MALIGDVIIARIKFNFSEMSIYKLGFGEGRAEYLDQRLSLKPRPLSVLVAYLCFNCKQ